MIHVTDKSTSRVEERINQRQEFLNREGKKETKKRKITEKAGK